MNLPDPSTLSEEGELLPPQDSFTLLSTPVLDLSETDLVLIAEDLRAKRVAFLKGVADRPGRTALARAPKPTPEEKKARTEHLKTQLKLGGLKFE